MVTNCNQIVTKPSNDWRYTTHDLTVNPAVTHIMDSSINLTTVVRIGKVVASILVSWQPWYFPSCYRHQSFNLRKNRPSSAFVSVFLGPLYTRFHNNTVFTSLTSSELVDKWCELRRYGEIPAKQVLCIYLRKPAYYDVDYYNVLVIIYHITYSSILFIGS